MLDEVLNKHLIRTSPLGSRYKNLRDGEKGGQNDNY